MDCTIDNSFDNNDGHIHTSMFSDYLKEIGQYPILTREDEVDLFQKMYAGDIAAKEKLIQCNLRLVVSVIKKYTNIILAAINFQLMLLFGFVKLL